MCAWPSSSARTKNWSTEILTDADLEAQLDLLHSYFNDSLNGTTGHDHSGGTAEGPKISAATGLTIASQAQGDVLYASSSSAFARLGAGTAGQALTTGGAAANPTFAGMTTQGDIEFHNGTTRSRLAAGTVGYVLTTAGAGADPTFSRPTGFVAWTTGLSTGTTYLAATDLIVTATASFTSGTKGAAYIEGLTDASSPPTTRRNYTENTTSGYYNSITFPVFKGHYWRVNVANTANESVQTLSLGL